MTTRTAAFAEASPSALSNLELFATNAGPWTVCGKAEVRPTAESVIIRDGFLMNATSCENVEIRLRVRAPKDAPEVQLWAGFRARDRHHRYVVALRGGNNNHVYLARYGSAGLSRFLGVSPLDFSPEVGVWYSLRIVLRGKRIRVFLGDEAVPCVDVEDDGAGWTEGGVVLGGGYLPAEFSDLEIRRLESANDVADTGLHAPGVKASAVENREKTGFRHAVYQPAFIEAFTAPRTEIPLDGHWLFLPVNEDAAASADPAGPAHDDSRWHTIDVPNLWTPMLAWLHGETTFNEFEGVSKSKGVNDKILLEEAARLESYGFDWERTQIAWYRHHVVLPSDIAGRRFELCFDAVAKACEVWFNGALVGTHVGMFGELRCDVTDVAKPGANVLAVKVLRNPKNLTDQNHNIVGLAESVEVTTSMLSSMPRDMICHDPAGIWQPVKLVVTREVFVRDVFVQPGLDGARLQIEIGARESACDAAVSIGYIVRLRETGEVLVANDEAAHARADQRGSVCIDLPKVSPKLWHPETPHLYDLEIRLHRDGRLTDSHVTTFGFRTFSTSGNRFLLNGQPYWLRGANHFPHGVKPNDRELARRFIALAREGNVRATRSHVAPFTKAWVDETDRQGMLLSFEGIWPWLMLTGEIPNARLLDIWRADFAALIRKYRNHPSIVLWTINNEMKFYVFDADNHDLLRRKWAVVSDMIGKVRELDPTRPVVADSGYVRGAHRANYEAIVRKENFDDGDVDDVHQYYAWYHPSFTTAHQGEFARDIASPDRPFISQELSSGYPRNDDGLPVRFYLFKHGTPLALVGDYAFEHNDPRHFLERLAFILKNTGEAIRRSNRADVAGVMHFAYLTWFKNVHDEATIRPWTAPYRAIRSTLQPVLISADFFGRHFFQGDTVPFTLHIINDAADARALAPGLLKWAVVDADGAVLSEGGVPSPEVPYYDNRTLAADIVMPGFSDTAGRREAKLQFSLVVDGKKVSENNYDVVLGSRAWAGRGPARLVDGTRPEEFWLHDPEGAFREAFAGCSVASLPDFGDLARRDIPLAVVAFSGEKTRSSLAGLRGYLEAGGRLLLLNAGEALRELLPEAVESWRAVDGQIVNVKLPESPVFDGIEPLDLAWFNCGPCVPPAACDGVFQVNAHNPDVTVLAEFCDFHNYLAKPADIVGYSGTPLFECSVGKGVALVCELSPAALRHDPVASRVLFNGLNYLTNWNQKPLRP
jgi:beta-galactosidase